MAKQCMMRREEKRQRLIKKYQKRRQELRLIINDQNTTLEEKFAAQQQIQKLPKDSNRCRGHNRCWITGRAHGYYRRVGMCRNKFREFAMAGDLPGLVKASW